MKQKKLLFVAIFIIALMILGLIQPTVQATQATTSKYFGISPIRKNDTPNLGYSIGDPNSNTSTNARAARIWNILEYTGTGSNATEKANGSKNIYCVKSGVGFAGATASNNEKAEYNIFYNMKTEREAIKAQNDTLKSIVEGNVTYNNTTVSKYDALLALGDLLYLNDSNSSDAAKLQYLQQAGADVDENSLYVLTNDDIAAVQQAAVWYFTNYGEDNNKYDKTGNEGWLNYTIDGLKYDSLMSYPESGRPREQQAVTLYKYLIQTAVTNAKNQVSAATSGQPAKVATTSLNYEKSGSNYIIGPIHIDSLNSTKPYTIDFAVKNGDSNINYTLLNSQKATVSNGTTVKDLVGNDFYISVPQNGVTTISVSINIKYKDTSLTLWTSATNGTQPLMIPEQKEENIPVTLKVTPKEEGKFDLALRKYITKVNGTELTGANSRVPNISEDTLKTGTTATYKHKKDPVTVKTGDVVTYKMTIYNEGEVEGRATKIVDQLPTGLKYSKIVSGNFDLGSYNESTNTLNLVRKSGNTTNLPAYSTGKLSSETIEIECTVEAKPSTTDSKVLTNVAYISEEINGSTNTVITNQQGLDRDSEPATKPDVNKDNMSNYKGYGNKEDLTDSTYYYKGQQDDDDFEKLVILPESFDLKLIKRITAVNNQNVPERIQSVDVSKLNTLGSDGKVVTTGTYNLNKEPVQVAKGDIVTYTFRIYNEGTLDGYASEITEDIPEGLEFLWSEKEGTELASDTSLSAEEKEAIEFNQKYLWSNFQYNADKTKITQISSSYLSKANETTSNGNLIKAFGNNDGSKTEKDISYKEIPVKFKVTSDTSGVVIRNEACISKDSDEDGNEIDDRDSSTDKWVKYEDDEDYDNIILRPFDLALRKFIIAVGKDENIKDDEYLKNADGSYTRAPVVDTSKLNTTGTDGKQITTATYNHTKQPVQVSKNDMVIYMLRVYNEGDIDGYAAKIKDHLPQYLEYVDNDYNKQYGWTLESDGRTVTTTYLDNKLVKKAEKDSDEKYVLSYVEVPIMCKVSSNAKSTEKITNIADIAEYQDENKKSVTDRDSTQDNVNVPTDSEFPGYKDNETGEYIPGQEDDDDFEKLIIENFDLALRKQIVSINHTYAEKQEEHKDRYANLLDADAAKSTNTIYDYYDVDSNKPTVVENDVVTYSIRVYNEGLTDGTATWVTDRLPSGLAYIEDNETNKQYGWKPYKESSSDNKNAVKIGDKYYEETQSGSDDIVFYATQYLKDSTIKAYSGEGEANYGEVFIAARVKAKKEVNGDYVLRNVAEIGDDTGDDDDSTPGDNSEWKDQDDVDVEDLKPVEFDLSLRKWVTQAIVTDSTGTKITETGHQPYDDPEQIVKVDLHRKHVKDVVVKFRYSIRVTNEGDIAGYAKEVKDYIPDGLKFVAEDNPQWKQIDDKTITTDATANTLLQPGDYTDVEVLLTWENSEDNMGLKVNTAEISKDANEYNVPDRDSTPDNKKEGEDDIDDAPVLLTVKTGMARTYFLLGGIVLITLAGGITVIKKYIL